MFFNVPEGAVSILTDYCENGSLLDLLDSIFTLPECVIREIFVELFESLRKFYDLSDQQYYQYGGIAPSQVLFTAEGEVKLSMGLYYQLSNHSSASIYNLKAQLKQKYQYIYPAPLKWTPPNATSWDRIQAALTPKLNALWTYLNLDWWCLNVP